MKKVVRIEDITYVAGFFDGEGSIYITNQKRKNINQYCLGISFTNTNLRLLQVIKDMFGGNLSKSVDRRIGISRRQVFHLRFSSNQARNLLQTILPHLRIKKEQALLAIDFQSKMRIGIPISKVDRNNQLNYKNKMSKLNCPLISTIKNE
jgi:hypothetical protein